MALCRAFSVSVALRRTSRGFLRRGKFHPNQPTHAAFLHGHAIEHVGFGDRALVVGDDDELALRDEAVEHPNEPIDVAFIQRRIDFVEYAKRTRSHHVN